jgi:hypothetical protein
MDIVVWLRSLGLGKYEAAFRVAALRSDASGKTPSVDAATASNTPSTHSEDRAERRQVTVISDLVGSTALSARMDPEDLSEVITAYKKCVHRASCGRGSSSRRQTVRAARTPRHRHHPPGIKNFHSDSYAEIDTDSLPTRLRTLRASLPPFTA